MQNEHYHQSSSRFGMLTAIRARVSLLKATWTLFTDWLSFPPRVWPISFYCWSLETPHPFLWILDWPVRAIFRFRASSYYSLWGYPIHDAAASRFCDWREPCRLAIRWPSAPVCFCGGASAMTMKFTTITLGYWYRSYQVRTVTQDFFSFLLLFSFWSLILSSPSLAAKFPNLSPRAISHDARYYRWHSPWLWPKTKDWAENKEGQ